MLLIYRLKRAVARRMLLGALLSAALVLPPAALLARPAPTPPADSAAASRFVARPLPADPATGARLRQPAPARARLNELAGQRDFRYQDTTAPGPSAWDRFWYRVLHWLSQWLSGTSYQGFWRWVFYALFAAAGVFIVLKLLQVDLTAAFGRSPRRAPLGYDTAAENIHELDFAARLAEAEAAGNRRLALRLGYLQLLKQLSDQQLIDWQPDKTNQTYLRELAAGPRPALRPPFAELTRQFEYVWYGELPLSPTLYGEARASQQGLGRQLAGAVAG